VETTYKALKAKYETLKSQTESTLISTQEQTHRLGQSDAGIEAAKAAIDLAKLNLSYTVITAPCDGYTSKKDLQVGQLIQPGQSLVSIVDESDMWVIANYKETQTADMKIGDKVRITVDAVPGVEFSGEITAISKATGAKYSVIPQDNATGNFVKVEQRLPIKIRFSKDNDAKAMSRLRAGLNVECKVATE
jgi:membrane fusion protein (multidrug efflux system)